MSLSGVSSSEDMSAAHQRLALLSMLAAATRAWRRGVFRGGVQRGSVVAAPPGHAWQRVRMASLLEQTRVEHEEVERLERLVVDRLSQEAKSFRERLEQCQTVAYLVDQITHRAAKLVRAQETRRVARCSLLCRVALSFAAP